MDTYRNFKELKASETEWQITFEDRRSPVSILAPHGGDIEPHTSDIASLVAADKYNLFCFDGGKKSNNQTLHITSHKYDEQQALSLVRLSLLVITIHGCTQTKPMVFIGGLHTQLKENISQALDRFKVPSVICARGSPYGGQHPENICNKGLTGKGVQLEISRPLRDTPLAWYTIARAIREALDRLCHNSPAGSNG